MIPPSHPRGIGPDPFHNLDLSFHFPCLPNPEDAGRAPATLQVAVHGYGTLIPVLKFMHFPHWTGASSLQTSMQKDVLRSHRMGSEHLLGVPMFLEVLMGSRVALKCGPLTTSTGIHLATWRKCSFSGPTQTSRIRTSGAGAQPVFTRFQVILKHHKV